MANEVVNDPVKICTDLLVKSGDPMVSGDFAAFALCFHLPQMITTPLGVRIISTRAELFDVFTQVRSHLFGSGAVMLSRTCVKADFATEDTIFTIHEGLVVGKKGALRAPYEVFAVLQKKEGNWRVAYSDYAIGDSMNHCRALLGQTKADAALPDPDLDTGLTRPVR